MKIKFNSFVVGFAAMAILGVALSPLVYHCGYEHGKFDTNTNIPVLTHKAKSTNFPPVMYMHGYKIETVK